MVLIRVAAMASRKWVSPCVLETPMSHCFLQHRSIRYTVRASMEERRTARSSSRTPLRLRTLFWTPTPCLPAVHITPSTYNRGTTPCSTLSSPMTKNRNPLQAGSTPSIITPHMTMFSTYPRALGLQVSSKTFATAHTGSEWVTTGLA